jgi:hypothetical protein
MVAPPPAVVPPPPAPAAAPAAPAAPANWYDKFAADAFVDAYGAVNWNFPKPQGPTLTPLGFTSGTALRFFDVGQGFALNWIGLNGSYAADPIGGTISLRFGPGATIYNVPPLSLGQAPPSSSDNQWGLQNVRQAYATLKADKLTVDFGKYDQPFGSEVPDAQLNMEYTRSLLFTLNQPVFFTGLRLDYAVSDAIDAKLFVANGWNTTFDTNRGKSYGAQISVKPIDQLQIYLGYMGGPEQGDFVLVPPATAMASPTPGHVPNANDHWRHLVDLVLDINPTKQLRFLVNGDYDTEEKVGANADHAAIWYGANLAIRYQVTDPFAVTLRGEVFHDEHGDIVVPGPDSTSGSSPKGSTLESGSLTLMYVIASHLSLMFDNRIDIADSSIFQTDVHLNNAKTQFTTTLGVIVATK